MLYFLSALFISSFYFKFDFSEQIMLLVPSIGDWIEFRMTVLRDAVLA